jgi:hypothetical protein
VLDAYGIGVPVNHSMRGDVIGFVAHGAITLVCLVGGVLCLVTYWRDRSERVYLFFAVAFALVGPELGAAGDGVLGMVVS